MGAKKAKANPCFKKGKDNPEYSSLCECKKACDALLGFKEKDTEGTLHFLKERPESLFRGCMELDQYLIDHKLYRVEAQEPSGFDVLFNGLEKIYYLDADYVDIDGSFDAGEKTIGEAISSCFFEPPRISASDFEEPAKTKKDFFIDEASLGFAPAFLGYGSSMAHNIFALAPDNLDEVAFIYLFKKGEFEKIGGDIYFVSKCIFERRDLGEDIKERWPRYTKKRFEKYKNQIDEIVRTKSPFWIKRFRRIWSKLTPAQTEAIKAEYFHGEVKKPNQKLLAASLGISVDSYKERLEWAYKKIDKLFPEYERMPRRKKREEKELENPPAPLYQILESGEKIEIPFPIKVEKGKK